MSPRFLLAVLILELICFVNVSVLSTMTPRSFSDSTFSIGISSWSFSWYMSGSYHDFLNACVYTF